MSKINLNPGETYIGAIGNKAGEIYHLIKLAGEAERAPQEKQIDWAKSVGGDLPNKIEAAMLFAHDKDAFQPEPYWTNETFIDPDAPEETAWAWCQYFGYGGQNYRHKDDSLRAVAVRRIYVGNLT